MKLPILAVLLISCCFWQQTVVESASNPRALNILRLIADVLYKSPSNNDFVVMVENQMMDSGIADLISGMSFKFAARDACNEFKNNAGKRSLLRKRNSQDPLQKELIDTLNSADGQAIINDKADGKFLPIPPPRYSSGGGANIGKRQSQDPLQKELLDTLSSPDGQAIINDKADGKFLPIPPPRYSSGGGANFGKRQAQDPLQKELIDTLNSADGQAIINDKADGKFLPIPPPRYSSGGGANFGKRGVSTAGINLSDPNVSTSVKANALLARVRNIIVNQWSRDLFVTALDDGTLRAAMYNICGCNAIASTIRYYYDLGVY